MRIVTTHVYADFDALASATAAVALYAEACLFIPKPKARNVEAFLKEHPEFAPKEVLFDQIDPNAIEGVVVVDTSDVSRLGELGPWIEQAGPPLVFIDHHPHPKGLPPSLKTDIRAPVGACSSLVVRLLKEKGLLIGQTLANLLLLGVYEDTGGLMNVSTTQEDFEACAWLLGQGARVGFVRSILARSLTLSELEILHRLKSAARFIQLNGSRLLLSHAEVVGHEGELSHLVQEILDISHASAAIAIFECEGRMLVVGRSVSDTVRLDGLFVELGGGGHPTAASASLPGQTLVDSRVRIEALVQKHLVKAMRAEEVMSAPPISVLSGQQIEEALLSMNRYAVNGLVVLDPTGRLVGLFTRMIAERALYHGLHGAHVADFMITEFETTSPYAPLDEVGELLVRTRQRLLPVLRDGQVIGVVTRKDYLREMLKRTRERPVDAQTQEVTKQVKSQAGKHLPEIVRAVFLEAGRLGFELAMPAYAVGGFVRDLLLGTPTLDFDIVVVGDGLRFASKLAERLGCKMRLHEAFGTASLYVRPDVKLDIATARIESYEYPGAWPKVVRSTLKQDLARRDFTVNTLALDLRPERFLELADFYGGLTDLKHRLIRVLHNLSLVEDPTRVFRAYRFALRLGFKLSKETERLIKKALELGFVGKLEGGRVLKELGLIAYEPKAIEIVEKLGSEGVLRVVAPELDITPEKKRTLQGLGNAIVWFSYSFPDQHVDTLALILAALLLGERPEARGAAFRRLQSPPQLQCLVQKVLEHASGALTRLESAKGDAVEIDKALRGLPKETTLFVMALTKNEDVREHVVHYLLVLSKVFPEVRGKDLVALGFSPSPKIGKILETLRAQKLRGRLLTKQEELSWVLKHFCHELPDLTCEKNMLG